MKVPKIVEVDERKMWSLSVVSEENNYRSVNSVKITLVSLIRSYDN